MKFLKLVFIVSVAFLFIKCENEINESLETNTVDNETLAKIAKLGFDTVNYPVSMSDDKKYFNVEEDISFPVSYLDNIDENGQSKQRRWVNIVNCDQIRFITVFNNLPAGTARSAVAVAMRNWNEIDKSNIRFEFTGDINSAEIIISNGPLGDGTLARATFPENGIPGKFIRLDLNQFSNLNFPQWRSTIAHELGHCIGFAHTQGTGANGPLPQEIFIPGTPGVDENSLMNARRGGTVRVLTDGDKRAARRMYNLNFAERLCQNF